MNEIDRAVAEIGDSPTRWPQYRGAYRYFQLKRFPYLIIYYVAPARVEIVAVAHGRQRTAYWKKRKYFE
jgi:plasmid stabilization system protein ParE